MSRRAGTCATVLGLGIAGALLWSCSSDTHSPSTTDTSQSRSPLSRHHDGHGHGGAPDAAADLDTSPTITDFVLYAERSVRLGRDDRVQGGDVGVAAVTAPGFGPQLIVGEHSFVDPEEDLLAPSVRLDAHSFVGDVETSSLTNSGGRLRLQAPLPSPMPPVPVALASTPGAANVSVDRLQFQRLAPGAYATLTVNGTLLLEPGVFSFSAVTVGDDARVLALPGAATDVRGAGTLSTGRRARRATLEPVDGGDHGWGPEPHRHHQPASQLSISVFGYDTSSPSWAASIGARTVVDGLVFAPHGTLALGDDATATGAFAGFDIRLGDRVSAAFDTGFAASSAGQQGSQQLTGYVTPNIAAAPVIGPVPPSTVLTLDLAPVPQNPAGLAAFAQKVSDPKSSSYRQYLGIDSLNATYGPTGSDAQHLADFARASNLTVLGQSPLNIIVVVQGTVADLQPAFHVNLNYYSRPDGSQFFALDREPSIDLATPMYRVVGLQNYFLNMPFGASAPTTCPLGGSNCFAGPSFDTSYLAPSGPSPCSGLTGQRTTIALFELDKFNVQDIQQYAMNAGIPASVVNNNVISVPPTYPNSWGGSNSKGVSEVTADIEIAMSVAPGAQIWAFNYPNDPNGGAAETIAEFDQIALYVPGASNCLPTVTPCITTLNSSWPGPGDPQVAAEYFQSFAGAGVSIFQASGDLGAYNANGGGSLANPSNLPPVEDLRWELANADAGTLVGGTAFDFSPPMGMSAFEATWQGSGGGFFVDGWGIYGNNEGFGPTQAILIPPYQAQVLNPLVNGQPSSVYRNAPDVSAVASGIYAYIGGAQGFFTGTSGSAPIWAGISALANQQSATNGVHSIGNINRVIYDLAGLPANFYSTIFNDITSQAVGSTGFATTAGYDLATGLGSPTGSTSIHGVN